MVHGPQSHHRLEIPKLFMEQLVTHILTLLKFRLQRDDPTSHLIQANMEAYRLEAGLRGQIFGLLLEIRPCLTQSWFTQTWQHCKELDIDIRTDIKDFVLPQQGDREIMQIFLQSGVTGQNLIELN